MTGSAFGHEPLEDRADLATIGTERQMIVVVALVRVARAVAVIVVLVLVVGKAAPDDPLVETEELLQVTRLEGRSQGRSMAWHTRFSSGGSPALVAKANPRTLSVP